MKKAYKIEVDCANCANKMEQSVQKISGITSASVNFMTQKLFVEFSEDADIPEVLNEIIKKCKKIERNFNIIG